MLRKLAALLLTAGLVALAACGADGEEPERSLIPGRTLTVYTSLPRHGDSSRQADAVAAGQRLALADAGGRAADYRVRLVELDSSDPLSGGWDPATVKANAEHAAADPTTIAYLGELDYGGSAVSVPVTNQAGILQVSPGDGLTSLTQPQPGGPSTGAERYYPRAQRTFLRLVPSDLLQARTLVDAARETGARSVAVLHDGQLFGRELASQVGALAAERGLAVTSVESVRPEQATVEEDGRPAEGRAPEERIGPDEPPGEERPADTEGPPPGGARAAVPPEDRAAPAGPTDGDPTDGNPTDGNPTDSASTDPDPYRAVGARLAEERPDAVVYTGLGGDSTASLYASLARALPRTRWLGGGGVAAADPVPREPGRADVLAVRSVRPEETYPPVGRRLLRRLAAARGAPVGVEALYGYESMRLVLDAVARAGAGATDRAVVVREALDPRMRTSVLGPYRISMVGDVSESRFAAYRWVQGRMLFVGLRHPLEAHPTPRRPETGRPPSR